MNHFAGIKKPYGGYRAARAVILPVSYDRTASYRKGTLRGPAAILDASCYLEDYDDELGRQTYRSGIATLRGIGSNALQPETLVRRVRAAAEKILRDKKLPVIVGGEHTASIGAVQAAAGRYSNLTVLHLDAHADLRQSYKGNIYSHGCVARRFLDCAAVVSAGVRSMSAEEAHFARRAGRQKGSRLRLFMMDHIRKTRDWKKKVVSALSGNVYVSIDLDVFDPSLMPAVGTPEPGGLFWYDVLDLLKMVSRARKVRGFDVVELMPLADNAAPDYLAAKLIYRFLGYILV